MALKLKGIMKWRPLIGFGFSLGFLILIFQLVDFKHMMPLLRSVNLLFILSATLVISTTLVIRSWRWKYLIQPIKAIKFYSLLSTTSIGAMIDMVFPARTGDIVRSYILGQREQVSFIATLTTVAVEKVFDFLTILILFIFIIVFTDFSLESTILPRGFKSGVLLSPLVILLLLGSLFFIRSSKDPKVRLVNSWLACLPEIWRKRVYMAIKSLSMGLHSIQKDQNLIYIAGLSFLLWSMFALGNFLILRSFHLNLPVYASFLLLVFQVVGVTLPSTPGFIGTYHAAVLIGFNLFEVSQDMALSVAIVMHAAYFLPFIIIGFYFGWSQHLSLEKLRNIKNPET